MATYRGMDGSVFLSANQVGEIKSWSLSVTGETIEDTAMGDAWRTFVGGLADWSGQATANLDYGDTNGQKVLVDKLAAATPPGTTVALSLRQSATKTWSGNALLSGFNINQAMGAIVEVQFSFRGTGSLAVAWA